MKKNLIKSFALVCALVFAISCNNKGTTGPGGGGTTPGGQTKWFLTKEQQKKAYDQGSKVLWTKGQNGAQFYRIAAINVANNNTIIAASDKRWNGIGDLPAKIDVVIKKSYDGGFTWTEEQIVGTPSTGPNNGHGDPFIIKCPNGDLLIGAVAGPGWWNASFDNPGRVVISRSTDNGETWTDWEDITKYIYGKDSTNPKTTTEAKKVLRGFGAAGNGAVIKYGTHKNRIMFGMYVETSFSGNKRDSALIVYSDDNGKTWDTSEVADDNTGNFNEPKVFGLKDGKVMLNIRPKYADRRRIAYSTDGGINFSGYKQHDDLPDKSAANADLARLSCTLDGDDKDRILFINPSGNTGYTELAVKVSYDEGNTWKTKKILNPGGAAYASIAVAPDGTILTLAEERVNGQPNPGWNITFRRFNLAYITDGADTFGGVENNK